jgi:hypothetical protein
VAEEGADELEQVEDALFPPGTAGVRPVSTVGERLPAWDDARTRLDRTRISWLTPVCSDGRPHVAPRLGVLVDDGLHFVALPAT